MNEARAAVSESVFLWVLILFLAICPIPLASNRPFFWYANGAVIALLALSYSVWRVRAPAPLSVGLSSLVSAAVLYTLAIAWMFFQLLPLPGTLIGASLWQAADDALGTNQSFFPITLDPAATWGMVTRYLTYALLFFLIVQLTLHHKRSFTLLSCLFWIVAAHAAFAMLSLLQFGDTILFMEKWAYQGFATGTFVNRNSFATYLAFGLTIGTSLWLHKSGLAGRSTKAATPEHALTAAAFYGSGSAFILSALLLTGSRSGLLAAVIGVLTTFALVAARSRRRRMALMLMLASFATFGATFFLLSGAAVVDRLGSIESDADERVQIYRQVLAMIGDRPLVGFGGGSFGEAFQLYHEPPLRADVTWTEAHNTYLELIAELGVLGVAPVIAVGLIAVRQMRELFHAEIATAIIASMSITILLAVHSTVDFSLQIQANALTYTAVLAAGLAQAEAARKSRTADHLRSQRPTGEGWPTSDRSSVV